MASLHISPASCCGRRCTAPSGVFSPRGARRTASTRSAPCEARPGPPASSVACAMGPYSRRRDDGDVPPSPRSGNEEDGAMAPQPLGPMGVVADLFVARRRRCSGIDSSSRLDLGSRAPSADGTARRDLMVIAGEVSGDIHAGNMLAELHRTNPEIRAFGVGGEGKGWWLRGSTWWPQPTSLLTWVL